MKMVLDDAAGLNLISAVEADGVKIRGQFHKTGLLIQPREIDTAYRVDNIETLDSKKLRLIAKKKPELLLIGTGERQRFPNPRIFIPLMDAGIGYEVMDNASACRTFNILLTEGRNASLLLLKEPRP